MWIGSVVILYSSFSHQSYYQNLFCQFLLFCNAFEDTLGVQKIVKNLEPIQLVRLRQCSASVVSSTIATCTWHRILLLGCCLHLLANLMKELMYQFSCWCLCICLHEVSSLPHLCLSTIQKRDQGSKLLEVCLRQTGQEYCNLSLDRQVRHTQMGSTHPTQKMSSVRPYTYKSMFSMSLNTCNLHSLL